MEWKHIRDEQPEDGRNIVQCDPADQGHYCLGMRIYKCDFTWDEYMQYCIKQDWFPDFWWVYADDFPFPKEDALRCRRCGSHCENWCPACRDNCYLCTCEKN